MQDDMKELIRYKIQPEYSHYCSTTIFALSNKSSQPKSFKTSSYAYLNFCLPFQNSIVKDKEYGFVLSI